MTRVANLAQHNQLTSLIFGTQSRINDFNLQVASGKNSQDYKGISAESSRLVSLEVSHTRVSQFVRNNEDAERQLTTMETNVAQILDIMTEFKTLLVSALNADNAQDLNMTQQAQQMLDQVAALLNEEEAGRFLFAGSMTNTQPVDLTALPVAYTVPTVDGDSAAYYQGDTRQHVIRAAENFDITYGVHAGEQGFERAIRALDVVIKGGPTDRTTLEHALGIVNQTLEDIPDIRTRIGVSHSAITDTNVKHQEFLLFTERTISEIENVDLAKAVTQMNAAQVSLDASFLTLARLGELTLMNFLR